MILSQNSPQSETIKQAYVSGCVAQLSAACTQDQLLDMIVLHIIMIVCGQTQHRLPHTFSILVYFSQLSDDVHLDL